jgi:hypothetical protein
MAWPVEVTVEFEAWYSRLGDADREAVNAAVDTLEVRGPRVSAAPWLVQPRADDLQDLYLAELGEEGLLPRE